MSLSNDVSQSEAETPYDNSDSTLMMHRYILLDGARQIFRNARDGVEAEPQEAYESYTEFLMQSVEAKPDVLTIFEHYSLLHFVLRFLPLEWAQPAIKCLIEKRPSDLLSDKNGPGQTLVHCIANHDCHHVLMPWIASEYSWVLDKVECGDHSPDIYLVCGFASGRVNESVLRNFLQVYPRVLLCQGNGTLLPLNHILSCRQECGLEFFQWMVGQNPSALSGRYPEDKTMLQVAIAALKFHKSENMAGICKFIIEERPDLAQDQTLFETFCDGTVRLPYCYSKVEQDVLTKLLEVYSEPFDLVIKFEEPRDHFLGLRNNTFGLLKSLLDQRTNLKEFASGLHQGAINLIDATSCTKNKLYTEPSTVFDAWSTSMMPTLEETKNAISIEIDQVWTNYEVQHNALVEKFNAQLL